MNPFTPGFGTTPLLIVGRDQILEDVAAAFSSSYDPHRTTWLRAGRGTGKTVLLNEIQSLAEQAGWIVVQEDAQSPGSLAKRISQRLKRQIDPNPPHRRFKSASVTTPIGGASLEVTDLNPTQPDELRDMIVALLTGNSPPQGVLITVDEIHTADRQEVAHYGNVIQHLIRQDRPVASVVAGLPVADQDDLATFLGRCTKPQLENLPASTVAIGLQHTARIGGGGFTSDALKLATNVIAGYPYMLQLVGYWSWRASDDGKITTGAVRRALPRCQHELVSTIPSLREARVSNMMSRYLHAMSVDDGPSRSSEIARRLNINPKHAGVYRQRLIDAGLIESTGHGDVDFVLPGHRTAVRSERLLKQHSVSLETPAPHQGSQYHRG